jgi:hypothetical protein
VFKETVMTYVAALLIAFAQPSLVLQGSAPEGKQDQDRIQDLIRKLGSDDFATREQASEELKKAGKPAREALQKAADESDDPEIRQRAKTILEDTARAEKAPPRRMVPAPLPGRPGFQGFGGSSVTVRSINGDSTYVITPGDGSPVLTFHKSAAGTVKLDYADDKGEAKSAESATLAAFVKDHKELAEKFGISEEGINYAGSRVSFKGNGLPPFALPRFPLPPRGGRVPPPPAPAPAEEEEGTPVAGALLGGVDDSLRAQLDIPDGQGAVVTRVTPGSVADSLGLRKNDVLLEVDGKKIASPEAAKGLITKESSAVVLRKGKKSTLSAKKDF